MNFSIRTYNSGQMITGFHFFILSRGQNSGKPGRDPWCNCFVFESDDENLADRFYWLCYACWYCGKFRQYLVGSVIDLIRISDLKQVLELADSATHHLGEKFYEALDMMHQIEAHSVKTIERLKHMQRMKVEILRALVAV